MILIRTLKAWGAAGRAAILMLCVLVAARAAGAYPLADASRPCHEAHHGASASHGTAVRGHDAALKGQAAADHAPSDDRASAHRTRHADAVSHHPAHAADAEHDGAKHDGAAHVGCACGCGWLCSTATLTASPALRLAPRPGGTFAMAPAAAPKDTRPRGLFRPPRNTAGLVA